MNTSEEYEHRLLRHNEQFVLHQIADFRDDKEFFSVLTSVFTGSFLIFGVLGLGYWTAGFFHLVPWDERATHSIFILLACVVCGVFGFKQRKTTFESQQRIRENLYTYHDEKFANSSAKVKTEFMAYKECLTKFPETNMDKAEKKFKGYSTAALGVIFLVCSGIPYNIFFYSLTLSLLTLIASYHWFRFKSLRNDFDESRDIILDQATYHLLEAKLHSHS